MDASPKTRIFRLTHYKNLPFIFQHGLHCATCDIKDPGFINIGFQSLIDSRGKTRVNVAPHGVLNDYIPFYFATRSPMLFMIYKGQVEEYAGNQDDLVYLVSNVEVIKGAGIPFVFTDRHAKLNYATHYNQYGRLNQLDWDIIRSDSWGHQYGVQRKEIKQAEFLVHHHLPFNLIKGIICHNEQVARLVETAMKAAGVSLPIAISTKHYY